MGRWFVCALLLTGLSPGALAAVITLDFDSVVTEPSPGSFVNVDSAAYFASYGVTLTNNSPGTTVEIINYCNMYGCSALLPYSAPNFLHQSGSNAPVSYTLSFATPLTSFGFTIPGDNLPSAFPAWTITAYDGPTPVAGAGQGFTCCHPPLTYLLSGANITSVVVSSNNGNFAAFSSIPLDNLILTTAQTAPEPATLGLLGAGIAALGFRRRRANRESY
jgi:hypothetical protein